MQHYVEVSLTEHGRNIFEVKVKGDNSPNLFYVFRDDINPALMKHVSHLPKKLYRAFLACEARPPFGERVPIKFNSRNLMDGSVRHQDLTVSRDFITRDPFLALRNAS